MNTMIGFNLYTSHTHYMPCDFNPGVYMVAGGWGAGLLKNSGCRTGAWGAWVPETNVLTVGPVDVKAGVMLGLITGYAQNPVSPLVVPSVALRLSTAWYRLSYLPRAPGAATDGWHVSIEFDIK